jgi:predicted ATPase/class 3 adenylate cyclase
MPEMSVFTQTGTLPSGTVTFLFTDIEGSTRLLQRLGDDYPAVLGAHQDLLRAAFTANRGQEFGTEGDAFFVAFASASDAIDAAIAAQRALQENDWSHGEPVRVRIGIHTGEPILIDNDYIGIDVHRAARICSAAHGGQIVISGSTFSLVGQQSRGGVSFKDLGSHRLKDLEHAERILQLVVDELPSDFPSLRSARPPTNLPRHGVELVGRQKESRDLRALLLSDDSRLITICGTGGTGKTRLAISVATGVIDDFSDGVFFVDLSTSLTAATVLSEIAQILGISADGERLGSEHIVKHISEKRVLLLLDNFEQVVDAATIVSELVHGCTHLHVLVTSRISLSIGNETEYPLAPLSLPAETTRSEAERSEAAELFVKRAAAAKPGFALTDRNANAVAQICTLLDGLPLAIELAAARIKLLSPEDLLTRLNARLKLLTGGARDAPVRQRALRTTIDWSYDLLSPEERSFFRDLSVFSGGATLQAIEEVVAQEKDALDPLTSLLNHSLIRRSDNDDGQARFNMLMTIHEYAREALEGTPNQSDLRDRHAHYYVDLAEQSVAQRGEHSATLGLVHADLDNMRAALTWLLKRANER